MKIECYNERNARSCNVRLTNLVETVNAAGINISLPQGTIKLNISPLITHLKFMLHGVQWIVKVTNRISLGNDLYNISYSIDWLKDYWLKYADNTGHYMIARSGNIADWNRYIPDPQYPLQQISQSFTVLGNKAPITPNDVAVYVVINQTEQTVDDTIYHGTVCYGMDIYAWWALCGALMTDADTQNAVVSAFIAPKTIVNTYGGAVTNTVYIHSAEPGETGKKIPANKDNFKVRPIIPNGNNMVTTNFNTGFNLPYDDWRDNTLKRYSCYIPLLGNIELKPEITRNDIIITYLFDMIDGTVSGIINDLHGTRTAQIKLPQLAVPNSSAPQTIRQLSGTAFTNAAAAASSSAIGVGLMGLGLTNPVGTGVALSSAMASLLGNAINYAVGTENANYGAVSSTAAAGYYSPFHPQASLTVLQYETVMDYADFANLKGYVANKYVEHLSDLTPGYYWLDCSNALIYGGSDYESAYRQALHNVRINVN